MKFVGIIPARYASTRFEGKPLVDIDGKPMIQHVYERACQAIQDVCVATDDVRIEACVKAFGGKALMTSSAHKTGTDRCFEALQQLLDDDYQVVVNIQGDEPFIDPEQITALMACFHASDVDIATLIKPFPSDTSIEELQNRNVPKVVVDCRGRALLFSRAVIPCLRNVPQQQWAAHHQYYRHVGIYAYRTEALAKITQMPQTPLEIAESLEQLRWLENGLHIQTAVTFAENYGIDTPEDLAAVLKLKKL
ncbi:MAG: 3-deoxy-manno-octulosonate cytidylyltransferase [Prevotellaceae bacterium]|jgi:3-deoxy-manno-octulosonate cytidylyltransferase (CMP-KDO synthetase)|nr:3-deoxy-manno-octulosonate cytidylyltransferase [Prevotellaceae bacterium]